MLSWEQLVWLPEPELDKLGIAEKNLACAQGLPGSETIDPERCLRAIQQMAWATQKRTRHAQFYKRPQQWANSLGIFRIHAMISVLQREFGVRYNPAKIPDEAVFDLADSFIHGIIQGEGGTCGTLPVLYTAVGRRINYPLKLVGARSRKWMHFFVRWDDPGGERFNIEVNNTGLNCPSDDHYRTDLYQTREDWEESGSILKSMTPREELAAFMSQRAACWEDAGKTASRRSCATAAWASAPSCEEAAPRASEVCSG